MRARRCLVYIARDLVTARAAFQAAALEAPSVALNSAKRFSTCARVRGFQPPGSAALCVTVAAALRETRMSSLSSSTSMSLTCTPGNPDGSALADPPTKALSRGQQGRWPGGSALAVRICALGPATQETHARPNAPTRKTATGTFPSRTADGRYASRARRSSCAGAPSSARRLAQLRSARAADRACQVPRLLTRGTRGPAREQCARSGRRRSPSAVYSSADHLRGQSQAGERLRGDGTDGGSAAAEQSQGFACPRPVTSCSAVDDEVKVTMSIGPSRECDGGWPRSWSSVARSVR